jgi:xylose isomerase
VAERYAGWDSELGRTILGGAGLDALAERVRDQGLSPAPRSGRQERLENVVNRFVWYEVAFKKTTS